VPAVVVVVDEAGPVEDPHGIEGVDDLTADLEQAFDASAPAAH
jgi:hypothetical protein